MQITLTSLYYSSEKSKVITFIMKTNNKIQTNIFKSAHRYLYILLFINNLNSSRHTSFFNKEKKKNEKKKTTRKRKLNINQNAIPG